MSDAAPAAARLAVLSKAVDIYMHEAYIEAGGGSARDVRSDN